MLINKTDIQAYINFIKKALGQQRGYKINQRQEIIQQFHAAGFTNLASLLDTLQYLLEAGKITNNFTLEDVQKMLTYSPEKNDQSNVQEEYQRLQDSLVIVPEDFKQTVFVINDITTKFFYKYPGTVVLEELIASSKERLKDFVSKFSI